MMHENETDKKYPILRRGRIAAWVCIAFSCSFAIDETRASNAKLFNKQAHAGSGVKKIKLEELVNELDAVNPWSVANVSHALGANLNAGVSNKYNKHYISYIVKDIFYEEGLAIKEVELQLQVDTKEMVRLILELSDSSSCFTHERVLESFPDIGKEPYSMSFAYIEPDESYVEPPITYTQRAERAWGYIHFRFIRKNRKWTYEKDSCLTSIAFVPDK